MGGQYLRSNFRRTGGASITRLGGGYPLTSYAGGAGLKSPYGGFIMGSQSWNGVSVATLGAQSAMSAWFGNTYESGYKIKVIAINIRMASAAAIGIYASNEATSYVAFYPINSAALGAGGVAGSYTFEWAGFITSSP